MLDRRGPKYAALSVDLDGLSCYHSIHDLDPPGEGHSVHLVGLTRFLELFRQFEVPSTLFVISSDLEDRSVTQVLQTAHRTGHEIASHTHLHPYDFGQWSRDEIAGEIRRASDAIERVFDVQPRGFRAPGYNASDAVMACLEEEGYWYDSSVFPCPPYYLAKAAIMAGMRLVGKSSGSSLTDPRALAAPLNPYRPSRRRYYRPGRGEDGRRLWEIPLCVVPWLRAPVIGTSLVLMGASWFRWIYPLIRRHCWAISLEFHGIDLLDGEDRGVAAELVQKQPDLRRSVHSKRAIFADVIERIGRDYQFVTIADMAQELSRFEWE